MFKVMKGRNLQPRILYPAKLSFRLEREIEIFTNKKKLKEFSTTTSFTRNVKGTSLSKKEKDRNRNMKVIKEKISLVKANIH